MDCSMPGSPVHHQLLELAQTHIHRGDDAIQPSHPLLSPSPPALNFSQHQGLFQRVSSLHQVAKALEFQHQSFQWIFRTAFLWDWLVWFPWCPRDSQESSPTPQFKSINSSALSLLYSPTLTSIHDYWKNEYLNNDNFTCYQWSSVMFVHPKNSYLELLTLKCGNVSRWGLRAVFKSWRWNHHE